MSPPILEQLREQTRPAHLALENQPLMKMLLSDRLTESDYCHLLQSLLVFYQLLESELVPAAKTILKRHPYPDYQYLPRSPMLVSDCQELGCAFSCVTYPPLKLGLNENGAYLLGVLYVIEGSALGGQVIAKHLTKTLGLNEKSGVSFFNAHRCGNSWTAFCRWLVRDMEPYYQDDTNSIIEGANMTFFNLRTHIDQWHPH